MTLDLILLALAVLDVAAGSFDALETIEGLRLGVALEGNSIINFIAGSSSSRKPASWAIFTFNTARTVAYACMGFIPNPALTGIAIGAFISSIAGHIQAGLKWRYLNNGGQIDRDRMYSWWQKLLGMGWN